MNIDFPAYRRRGSLLFCHQKSNKKLPKPANLHDWRVWDEECLPVLVLYQALVAAHFYVLSLFVFFESQASSRMFNSKVSRNIQTILVEDLSA